MFGVDRPSGTLQGLATIPEFIWELGLGIYPIVWGFRASSPILAADRNASRKTAAADTGSTPSR